MACAKGSCSGFCAGGCGGGCTACVGCTSCTGMCTGGCKGCTGTCSGTCSGTCTSCSSCTGTCSGTCNNACTSGAASSTIAAIGANILAKGTVTSADFNDFLTYTVGEYTRRSLTPTYNAYSVTPVQDGKVLIEHATKILTDLNNFPSSGKSYGVTQYDIINTSSMSDAITYLQTLMNTNIVG